MFGFGLADQNHLVDRIRNLRSLPSSSSADRNPSVDRTTCCHGLPKWVGRSNLDLSSHSEVQSAYRKVSAHWNLGKIGIPNQTTSENWKQGYKESPKMETTTGSTTDHEKSHKIYRCKELIVIYHSRQKSRESIHNNLRYQILKTMNSKTHKTLLHHNPLKNTSNTATKFYKIYHTARSSLSHDFRQD